ncbi:MAG: GGDEF domain-containing protein [Burkholderiales bacterium]|nr:GGDEF domain-containing protein [Burkholderiales bacterium]
MPSILEHIAAITRNRDHALLDASVVSALHQITGASQVRVLDIVDVGGEALILEKAWIKDGKTVTIDDMGADFNEVSVPLVCYPAFRDCIRQRKKELEEITLSGTYVLWQPVWLNDKIVGCIQVENKIPLSHDIRCIVQGIMNVYTNYQSLIEYSERDSLTGLYNRKTFDEKFAKMACALSAGEQHHLAEGERRTVCDGKTNWLAVVDIDHFKQVNDKFGHLYGDEVLLLVANILKTSFRAQDKVFRFGGEEFVILLRSVTLESARKALDRFRQTVEKYDFPQVGNVTVSVGFVSITPDTPVVILGHADQALYFAKEHGRNQVCFYDELVEAGQLASEVSNESVEFF